MPDNVKNLYNSVEQLKGKRLIIVLGIVFVLFLFIGLFVGYYTNTILKQTELESSENSQETVIRDDYTGRVEYVNPQFYPGEDVSYVLTDQKGKEIILLKSKDAKLSIAEGLTVTVSGRKTKLKDGKTDVLNVMEVIIAQ